MRTVVKTAHGEVGGRVVDGVHSFLAVPYAAPPFGPNRLLPPQPVEPWDGVRDATRCGPSPPQIAPPAMAGAGWDTDLTGEDCLTLNVWTPDPGTSGLPVMVWIQGGAYQISATAAYDGSRFARDGVVCVVINWRVGADGFLHLGDGDSANAGLLDQVAALEWVRENVAAFGGDPGDVTVFGESAGAMSIGTLLAVPRAEGLFRRAILESGAGHHVCSRETAERVGHYLARTLGVPPTREALAAVPVPTFLAAQTEIDADLDAHPEPEYWGQDMVLTMPWQPVVDGDVLPGRPIDLVADGAARQVDLLVGTNTDDWRLFIAVTGEIGKITEDELAGPARVHGRRAVAAYGLPVERALPAYRERYPGAPPGELLAAVMTDWWTRIPALRLADAHAGAQARTFMYEFAWGAPGLGAVHGLEVPFVFDTATPDTPLFGPMLAGAPQELARDMHAAWIRFATDGDPGWPAYDLRRRATMRFDATSEVVDDPRSWERTLWDGLR